MQPPPPAALPPPVRAPGERRRLIELGWWLSVTLATLELARRTVSGVLAQTGGIPAVPLDDAFIHFQFAKSYALLEPLVYSPGDRPVGGATSLLWPLVLAPGWLLGLREEQLIWAAWGLGFLSLGLLAHETRRLAERLVAWPLALVAGALTLGFGGSVWGAGSGMEGIPFAWLLVRSARRASEWVEAPGQAGERRWRRWELLALAVLTPAMRPEGALASLLIAGALALRPRAGTRWLALPALGAAFTPQLLYLLLTGRPTSTTLSVKWLFASPYAWQAPQQLVANVRLLFGTLLDGKVWSAIFLPPGSAPVATLGLVALLVSLREPRHRFRRGAALVIALGVLIPATYDSFLWNRLRYLWPFAAGWFIGLMVLAQELGAWLSSLWRPLGWVPGLASLGVVVKLTQLLPLTFHDLAESSDAIRRQQVSLGHWARAHLPEDARIGVSDTGAIGYLSERRTFDVVGLTTRDEARYWAAGAGSRFEHYERLTPAERPTHFILYPHWFACPPLLGAPLTSRTVLGATILGGETMVANVADWSVLGSGERPLEEPAATLLDRLDVADLVSEAEHGYVLGQATQAQNTLRESDDGRADGFRDGRSSEHFSLEVAPGAIWVLRVGAAQPLRLDLSVDGVPAGSVELDASPWQERRLELGPHTPAGRRPVQVRSADGRPYAAGHYWSLMPSPRAPSSRP